MNALELLDHLHVTGVVIEVNAERLLVTPAELLTDADREAICSNKPELLAMPAGIPAKLGIQRPRASLKFVTPDQSEIPSLRSTQTDSGNPVSVQGSDLRSDPLLRPAPKQSTVVMAETGEAGITALEETVRPPGLLESDATPTPASLDDSSSEVVTAQTCRGCAHQTRYRTCREPVAAGLADYFLITWPPPDHAATCPAWTQRPENT